MRGVALCEPSAIRPVILPPKRSPQCWLFVAPSARGRHRLVDGAGLARGAVGDADARRERGPDDRAAHDTRRGSRKRSDPPSCEAQGGSSVGTKAPLRERHARESYKSCRRCLSNRRLRRESHSRTPYPSAKPTIRAIAPCPTRGAASPRSFRVPKCLNTATLGAAGYFAGLAAHQIGGVLEQLGV